MLDAFLVESMMQQAQKQALKALHQNEIPVGAVIFNDQGLVASAFNQKEQLQDPTAHAEILCIRQACQKLQNWRLEGYHLAVTLEPCPMCQAAIVEARLKSLIFGASITNPPNQQNSLQIIPNVQKKACQELLQLFFSKKRNP